MATPDNVTNELLFEALKAIQGKLSRISDDLNDIKGRMSALEIGLNGVRRDLLALSEADARLQVTIDRQSERLDRIDRRLGIFEGAASSTA